MTEEVDPDEPGGAIRSRERELSPERSAETDGGPPGRSHDRQLVAEQGRVRGESRDGRLAAPRRPAEQIRPAVPDEAGGVHDQPVRLDERQGVEDPDEALEGDVVRGQRDVRPARSDIDGARAVTT